MRVGHSNVARILVVLVSTFAMKATAWNSYSSSSLARVKEGSEARSLSSQKPTPTETLVATLRANRDEKQLRAALQLVLGVEAQILANGEDALTRPGVARTLALAEWDRLMTLPAALDLSDKFKASWREVVSDRFTTEHEFVLDAAALEASRRTHTFRKPRVRGRDSQPLYVFRQQIAQSLLSPIHQRVTARAFWNLTEEAFDRLQFNCERLVECENEFLSLLQTLRTRGEIDRPSEQKLRAIFHLRTADRVALKDLTGRRSEDRKLAKGAYDPKLLTLGFLAAENTANSLASGTLSPQGLVVALGAFFTAFLVSLVLGGPKMPFSPEE